MGYYTSHKLEVDSTDVPFIPSCEHENPEGAAFCMACGKGIGQIPTFDLVWDYIESADEMDYLRSAVGTDGTGKDSCKWYDHKDDMKVLSEKFPTVLFTLAGEGEEGSDLWVEYWHNGMVQVSKAEIAYAPFDPNELVAHKSRSRL